MRVLVYDGSLIHAAGGRVQFCRSPTAPKFGGVENFRTCLFNSVSIVVGSTSIQSAPLLTYSTLVMVHLWNFPVLPGFLGGRVLDYDNEEITEDRRTVPRKEGTIYHMI